jgi:thymidylate synthase (FAD)
MQYAKMQVYVIGRSTLDLEAVERFLTDAGLEWKRSSGSTESEKLVEIAGRVCYLSFGSRQSPRSNTAYINNLIANGHESVLEHASWTFLITGISRGLSHQLVRHRVGFSYSQLSQQYHEENEAAMVKPEEVNSHPEVRAIWEESVRASRTAYSRILDILRDTPRPSSLSNKEFLRNIRSAARSLLPNATETKIVVTANARALRHFLEIRGGIVGDEEMRRYAAALLECLQVEAPALFGDFRCESLPDGTPIVRKVGLPAELLV